MGPFARLHASLAKQGWLHEFSTQLASGEVRFQAYFSSSAPDVFGGHAALPVPTIEMYTADCPVLDNGSLLEGMGKQWEVRELDRPGDGLFTRLALMERSP